MVVIGGGIVGLAVARETLARFPGVAVTVLEKEPAVGTHQTGHNSGVVHAGLYYAPGSLKAALCRAGASRMRQYCEEKGLPFLACGKVVVALHDGELGRLADIEERAQANGVPDLARLDAGGLRRIEPHAAGIAALHSPHTAVTDFSMVARSFAEDVRDAGGSVVTGATVIGLTEEPSGVVVDAPGVQRQLRASHVIACAGVQSDRVARLAGADAAPRVVPFRGEYFRLSAEVRDRVHGLIYPVPDPRYPFLGIHLTRTVHGEVLVGPNAVLGLHRESYDSRGVRLTDVRDIAGFPGFWRFAGRHWRTGAMEVARSASRSLFIREARRYLPELRRRDVVPVAAGIRAQAVSASGALVDDFVIHKGDRIAHVRNAPSPAATASMAIAEHIVADVLG